MAKNQYSNSTSLPSNTQACIIGAKVGLASDYMMYQTGQYEYTLYVKPMIGEEYSYTVSRTQTDSTWRLSAKKNESFPTGSEITNTLHVYSNTDYGVPYDMAVQTNPALLAILAFFIGASLVRGFFEKCLKR